jgi:hypothetical protein
VKESCILPTLVRSVAALFRCLGIVGQARRCVALKLLPRHTAFLAINRRYCPKPRSFATNRRIRRRMTEDVHSACFR